MDPVPVRKRKADDDGSPSQPSPASSSAVAADQQQPPRLAIQTNTRPKPSSWISSPRTKRARLDSSSVTPTSSTPPSPSPSPSPSPAVLVAARPPPPSPRRSSDHPPPLTVSEIQTSIGLRWLWSSSPPPQRIIVPAFPPTSSPSSPNPNPNPQPHILIPIDPSSTHIPPRLPPINRTTLAELDMASVLRNPQLRHDLLFDANLQFRPSASRRKRAHADAYWAALARELNTRSACTCVSFDPAGNPAPDVSCVCRKIPCPPEEAPLLAFVPVRARLTLRMPSRLHPLLTELLALLLSLLSPPTTPLPLLHTPQQSLPSSPTTTTTAPPHSPTTSHHARVLTEALDADLLVQQVRRGLFEPERTFALVAEVMRAHCAPMRDGAVARMAALARTDAVRALRACFEILELMKLDVANHQMHALRPHIVAHAPRFERAIFADRFPVDTESGAVSAPRTRAWLRAADRALEAEAYTLPVLRPSSAAASASKPNATLAPKAYATLSPRARLPLTLLRALLDLIFPLSSSPSPSHELPETLHLDGARIGALARDAADLRAVHLLVLLFRQMCGGGGGNGGGGGKGREDVLDAHIGRFKAEMRELWPSALGRVFLAPTPSSTTTTTTNAAQDIPGLSALTLQLSARAAEFRRSPTTMPSEDPQGGSPPEPAPRALNDVVQGWVEKNVRAEAGVARVAGRRMRDAVMDRAARLVLGSGGGGEGGVGAGLEVMEGEVRRLAEGVARAAAIHLAVYRSVYDEGGFLDRE